MVTLGGVVNCLSCQNPKDKLFNCLGECQGRLHSSDNEVPFPEGEAYECAKPKSQEEFIKHGVIEHCKKCGKNEVPSGCHCDKNRECVCPAATHYVDSTGDCWKCSKCIDENSQKVRPGFCTENSPKMVRLVFIINLVPSSVTL